MSSQPPLEAPADFGVLFDVDDTLVDFAGAARSALLDVAATFDAVDPASHPAGETAEHLLRCWDAVSEREYARFLAAELSFDDMLLARMAAVVDELDPAGALGLDPAALELVRNESIFTHYRQYPDVGPALERFRAAGVRVAVVSNSDGDYQRRKMAAAGLQSLLGGAVFSGDVGVSKPDPEIFLIGAAALNLPADRVVYVGDRWATDAVGALRAGLSAVWLNRTGIPRPTDALDQLRAVPAAGQRLAELSGLDGLDVDLARALLPA